MMSLSDTLQLLSWQLSPADISITFGVNFEIISVTHIHMLVVYPQHTGLRKPGVFPQECVPLPHGSTHTCSSSRNFVTFCLSLQRFKKIFHLDTQF